MPNFCIPGLQHGGNAAAEADDGDLMDVHRRTKLHAKT
jgi:hypothetical protein